MHGWFKVKTRFGDKKLEDKFLCFPCAEQLKCTEKNTNLKHESHWKCSVCDDNYQTANRLEIGDAP